MHAPKSQPSPRRSRIYAGIELSQPVNLMVPIALSIVAFAVWRVRSLFWNLYVSSGPREYPDGGYEISPGKLEITELESAMSWLIVAAVACLFALLLAWWRGRREWGAIPLGYGIGLSGYVYLFASWPTFTSDGQVESFGLFDDGFDAALLLMLALGFLSYMSLELFTRRWRDKRLLVPTLLALLAAVPAIALPYGVRLRNAGSVALADGSFLTLELPAVVLSHDSFSEPLGARCGAPVYIQREGELWLARLGCSGRSRMLVDMLRLQEQPATNEARDEREAALDRMREALAALPYPSISIALSRSATPSLLADVIRDAKQRFPSVLFVSVIGSTEGRKPRGAQLPGSGGTPRWRHRVLMLLDVEPREPCMVLDVLDREAFEEALSDWRAQDSSARFERDGESHLQLRLRLKDDVSLEALGEFYSSVLWRDSVSVYVE